MRSTERDAKNESEHGAKVDELRTVAHAVGRLRRMTSGSVRAHTRAYGETATSCGSRLAGNLTVVRDDVVTLHRRFPCTVQVQYPCESLGLTCSSSAYVRACVSACLVPEFSEPISYQWHAHVTAQI